MTTRIYLLVVLLLAPLLAQASDQEVARLALLLQQGSDDLAFQADELSGSLGLARNARQLAAKARQLQDSLQQGRSSAALSLRFSDVSRYYQRLEAGMARLDARRDSAGLHTRFAGLAATYQQLHYQFTGQAGYAGYQGGVYNPAIIVIQRPPGGDRYVRNPDLGLSIREPGDRRGVHQSTQRSPVSERLRGRDVQHRHPSAVAERYMRRGETGAGQAGGPGERGGNRIDANQGYYRLGR